MKHKRRALFNSVISLLLCFSMLVGTTFAWMTDSVSSGKNLIATGTLDVELYHSNANVTDEQVTTGTNLFLDLQGKPILWEPGAVSYENLRVNNEGDLALAYQMMINTANENYVQEASGVRYSLSQILKVGVVESGITATDRAGVIASVAPENWMKITEFCRNGSLLPEGDGESEQTWGIVIYWEPGDHDNYWNLNNGKTVSSGDALSIDLGIHLIATQAEHESDSFGADYDITAKTDVFPVFTPAGSASSTVIPDGENKVSETVEMTSGQVKATVPVGVKLAEGTTELTMSVTEKGASDSNITLGKNEVMRALDVHIEGVGADNEVPMIIDLGEVMPTGLNIGNLGLYHVENGVSNEMTREMAESDVDAHNEYFYDSVTGRVVLAMATFSEVALIADTENAWEGKFDYSWYTNVNARSGGTEYIIANADQLAAFGAIVGGMNGQTKDSFEDKTVKLISDINLGDAEDSNIANLIFYPIGYYNSTGSYEKTSGGSVTSSVSSFEGTFDGNGHTIANFYQNTWEMFGDYNDGYSGTPNHYKDAMGLFGYVLNGTVKNLTVSNFSSDGEYTPTGVIAAYADGESTFANIAITNCNPRVYNTGNGGIIGIAGDTSAANDDHITLKNITMDNSNKISALWGSWDVACGGLVGMYRGNVDGSGKATGDTISFVNCHVSAQIDVYNDVCANYQYYAYRYAGMIIGSVRHNTKNAEGKTIPNMAGISASGCTVNYGTWNDYYYCEFEKNSMASYSEDYQFSRVDKSEIIFDENGKANGCTHKHTDAEDKRAVYLPFHQLFTGYSWGVSSIGLKEYSGIVTDLGITEGDQQASDKKFDAKEGYKALEEGKEYKFSDLFTAKKDANIVNDAVTISVTDIDNNDVTVTATINTNADNWQDRTVTFNNTGNVKITIQDYQFCVPTELTVEIAEEEKTVYTDRFERVFENTDKYLYRVGNKNAITISSLFEGKEGIGNVTINVEDANVTRSQNWTYTTGTEWNNGKLDFADTFTGPVTITISDDNFSEPVKLDVEVVDAYNVTNYGELKNRNSVLLNKIEMFENGTFWLENATLYGNGFEFNVVKGKDGDTTNGYIGGNYAVALKNATLDNVRVVGEVYTQYGATAKSMYNYPTILTNGNSTIANSYVSNGSAAVRAQAGNLKIINSTLVGGIFANLDIRGGTVTLDNVVTINQSTADGASISNDKKIVGLGIVFYECNTNVKLIIETNEDGTPRLTQYNMISKETKFNDTTVNSLKNAMFDKQHDDLQYTDEHGVVWINPCIVSATEGVNNANVWSNGVHSIRGYKQKEATVMGNKGYVFTVIPDTINNPSDYVSEESYIIPPAVVFNHEAEQNYKAPSADSNEHCYYNNDTKQLEISFDAGKNKVYDPNILSVTKKGEQLPYTVSIDGVDYTGKTITFDKEGTYTAEYTYTDPYNFRQNGDNIEQFDIEYKETVEIAVSVVAATAKDAKFTFYGYSSISKTAATTITDVKTATSKSGNLYIMPSSTGTNVTSTTVDGITVNCPRVHVDFKDNSSDFNWLYPVFLGVKIEDYADGGTADTAITIVSPTSTSKPANLTILTVDKPTGGGGWSSGSGKSGSEGKIGSGTYKNLYGWTSGALGSDQPANSIYAQFTYKDNKGTTYYYVIEFYRKAHDCPSACVTPDTLVTLADGTQKRIDALSFDDKILAWDFFTGAYVEKNIALLVNHGEATYNVANLQFSDGTVLRLIGDHGVFDYDMNKFVYITVDNMQDYVGHRFVQYNADGSYNVVTLDKAFVTEEVTSAYSITSAGTSNAFASGMLTVAPPEDFYNWIEMDSKLHFDVAQFQKDVETYGLYTYDDFKDYVTEEQFADWNGAYLKIAVEKGYFTFEYILELIELYKVWMPNI